MAKAVPHAQTLLLMLTIQATAEQAMLAPGLVAVAIVRAVLPAMPPAMHVLTQVRKRMTEAVAATVVPEQEPAHLALAPAYSIGVLTELALAIRDTQAQPAPAAPAAIATMALPAYHKPAIAAAAPVTQAALLVTAMVMQHKPVIRQHARSLGVLSARAHATRVGAGPHAAPR